MEASSGLSVNALDSISDNGGTCASDPRAIVLWAAEIDRVSIGRPIRQLVFSPEGHGMTGLTHEGALFTWRALASAATRAAGALEKERARPVVPHGDS